MEKSFKLLPPTMPNYIFYDVPVRTKQEGVNFDNKISIADLSEEEAVRYAELMKDKFMEHWTEVVSTKLRNI